jgi:hypothetical protein
MQPGGVVLAYDYASKRATLEDPLHGELSPHLYLLCLSCANKLTPPRGWELIDQRDSVQATPITFEEDVSSLDDRRDAALAGDNERRLSFGHGA